MAVLTTGAGQDSGCKSLGVKSIYHHRVYRQLYQTLHILITAEILFDIPLKRLKANAKTNPRPFLAFPLMQTWMTKAFWGLAGAAQLWAGMCILRQPAFPLQMPTEKGGDTPWRGARAAGAPQDTCSMLFPCPKSPGAAKLILHRGGTAFVCFWQGPLAWLQHHRNAALGVCDDLHCTGIQGPRPAAGPACKVLGRDTHADPARKKQVNRHI